MRTFITNFSLVDYFGCDGGTPDLGPWKAWLTGEDELLGPEFAEFVWWHLCGMMLLFDEVDAQARGGNSHSAETFEQSLNEYLALAETRGPLRLVNPFAFEGQLPHLNERSTVAALLAYGVWAIDRLIDFLRVGDAKAAAFASATAMRTLELVYEYRDDFAEIKAQAESKKQSERARARHAQDPKQKDKAFVRECWERWQEIPADYRSKAAFAVAMLDKCDHLQSTKQIEDWCRDWERESRRAAGKLRIVPDD